METSQQSALIIGAGLGGLASAIRLAAKGYKVIIYEKSSHPGGKCGQYQSNGYRFDTGPSLLTMPEVVSDLFEIVGKNMEDYLHIQKLPQLTKYYYPKTGKSFGISEGVEEFALQLEKEIGEPAENTTRFLRRAEEVYNLTREIFLESSLHNPDTYLNRQAIKTLANSHKLGMFATMRGQIENYFETPEARQLFSRFATYNGSDPYQAPATLNLISFVEIGLGGYYIEGGMYKLVEALAALATELGVVIRTRHRVEKIVFHPNSSKVAGVEVTDLENKRHETQKAGLVVCNADVDYTYNNLIPAQSTRKTQSQNRESSSSALVFCWGVRGIHQQLNVHNIIFADDYKSEFEHLFRHKKLYHDPTIYINITSKYSPADAPSQSENWFTMINAPSDYYPNPAELETLKEMLIQKIETNTGIKNLRQKIELEKIITAQTIATETSSSGGALYGNSSNSRFAAFLRQRNKSKKYPGLYFVGGSAHPGGGIPLVLLSAKIACAEITS